MKNRLAFEYDDQKDGDIKKELEKIINNKNSGKYYDRSLAYVLREFTKEKIKEVKKKLEN